jgi:secreted PhoX family phosphatase
MSVDPTREAERRRLLQGAAALASTALLSPLGGCASPDGRLRAAAAGFVPVPPSRADRPTLSPGYSATSLAAWGEPVGLAAAMPAWRPDASNSAADQAAQLGMHHGGLQFVPLEGSRRGLLVMNHGGADDGLLHTRGLLGWSAEQVQKSQAAHGCSVVEVAFDFASGSWQLQRPSDYARRITATTKVTISGPAAGHVLLKTAADASGRQALGVLAGGAVTITPWGTCLSGEPGFAETFSTADQPTRPERRYGLQRSARGRWPEFDERFDAVRHPNEAHRFGWICEFDPADPRSTPVKRTALGRGAHASTAVGSTPDGRAVVYLADSGAFEYLYKFVSREKIRPAGGGRTAAQANAELLDAGTLHVARFDADGSGRWLPLQHGSGPLTAAGGFADAAEVLIKTRQAADALRATPMDRALALALDPASGWVYVALGHNRLRGTPGQPGADAANPRADNAMGHILRWREADDAGGEGFRWSQVMLAGDPAATRPEHRGTVQGDAFACPGALALDARGRLWIGTAMDSAALGQPGMARLGNNQLLACDPVSGEVRRLLTGPVNSALGGLAFTPDGRTLFVNITHPGETPGGPSNPAAPQRHSAWPDFTANGRPRSATLALRRQDGAVVGS